MIKVDFGFYRCPNAQRRFRNVMAKFMADTAKSMLVSTIEPAALREFPAYVRHHTAGACVSDIQKQRLTDAEKAEALDFDDDALMGDVQERLIFRLPLLNCLLTRFKRLTSMSLLTKQRLSWNLR